MVMGAGRVETVRWAVTSIRCIQALHTWFLTWLTPLCSIGTAVCIVRIGTLRFIRFDSDHTSSRWQFKVCGSLVWIYLPSLIPWHPLHSKFQPCKFLAFLEYTACLTHLHVFAHSIESFSLVCLELFLQRPVWVANIGVPGLVVSCTLSYVTINWVGRAGI